MAGGDTGDLHHTYGVLELGAEAGVVVVLDRLIGVAHRGLPMADNGAEWHRPLRDGSRESAAAHLLNVAAEELDEIGNVAADVGECARSRCSLVPPTDRPLRVARVVAPVPAVDVQDATQHAGGDELAESSNARRPAEGEADADHRVSAAGEVRHGAGVLEVVAQRLLAEHVLAGSDQPLHDLPMQGVGHDHADDIDVGVLGNRLPGSVVALVPETPGSERAELGTDVSDGDEPQVRQCGAVKRRCTSVRGRVRPARHPRSDHCDADRHGSSPSSSTWSGTLQRH